MVEVKGQRSVVEKGREFLAINPANLKQHLYEVVVGPASCPGKILSLKAAGIGTSNPVTLTGI